VKQISLKTLRKFCYLKTQISLNFVTEGLLTYTFSKRYWGSKIQKDELVEVCNTYIREEKCIHFSRKIWKEKQIGRPRNNWECTIKYFLDVLYI
jgi:hypothetical protein